MINKYAIVISFTSLIWAGSFIAVKIAVEQSFSPILLGFMRFLIASPLMIIIMFLQRRNQRIVFYKEDIPSFVVLSLTGVTFLYIFQFIGIKYTTASNAAVLINTNVVFIALLSSVFLYEKLSRYKRIGILLAFIGASIISTRGTFSFSSSFTGDVLILCSALCWAIYSILGKNLLKKYDILTLNSYIFVFGTLFYVPFLYNELGSFSITFEILMVILYLAVMCTVVGYYAWYYALNHIAATNAAIFLNLIPIFTMIMAYFVFQEQLTLLMGFGTLLIFFAVYITFK